MWRDQLQKFIFRNRFFQPTVIIIDPIESYPIEDETVERALPNRIMIRKGLRLEEDILKNKREPS